MTEEAQEGQLAWCAHLYMQAGVDCCARRAQCKESSTPSRVLQASANTRCCRAGSADVAGGGCPATAVCCGVVEACSCA